VVGTGVVVLVAAVVVVEAGTVVVVMRVVVVVVPASLVLDEEVFPSALGRLAPQAVAKAASPPMAPTWSRRRRLSSPRIGAPR
jgi:hypothetical protein